MTPSTASSRLVLTDSTLFREACYIDGGWVASGAAGSIDVDNPATGAILGTVPRLGRNETRAAIDAAARAVITDAGYGPGFKYFSHRLGHGMGMDGHEWPYLVKNNMFGWPSNPTLQPGMVFSDEPGIYIKGEFGIRLEDDMHITATGAELLTPTSKSLEHPFD